MRIHVRRLASFILATAGVMLLLNLLVHHHELGKEQLVGREHGGWNREMRGLPDQDRGVVFYGDASDRKVESLEQRLAKYRVGELVGKERWKKGVIDDKQSEQSGRETNGVKYDRASDLGGYLPSGANLSPKLLDQPPEGRKQEQQQQEQQEQQEQQQEQQEQQATSTAAVSKTLVQFIARNGTTHDPESQRLWSRFLRLSSQYNAPPESQIWMDRILPQMSFVPKSYPGNSVARLKTIYVPSGVSSDIPLGREKFLDDGCPVTACNITVDILHEKSAELRLLQGDTSFESRNTLERKPPGQIWVMWLLESPENTMEFLKSTDVVNWTASYRWDSTIVTPYAKFVPYQRLPPGSRSYPPTGLANPSKVRHNYAEGKTEMVAWFVSNCGAANDRMEYAEELGRHVQVDIYGACGMLDCPRGNRNCSELLNRRYKFYLSFENSNCQNYITEKFFENALEHDIVPIVMGGRKADYKHAAPPHSFIHVDDFPSPIHLARYLLHLNQSDSEYNDYFRWKTLGRFIDTKFWCRLCALLHDDGKPNTWYRNFQNWWKSPDGTTCTQNRWSGPSG